MRIGEVDGRQLETSQARTTTEVELARGVHRLDGIEGYRLQKRKWFLQVIREGDETP